MNRIQEIEAKKKDLFKAMQNNEEGAEKAFNDYMTLIAEEAAEKVINDASDQSILAARGENILTKGELKFFNAIIDDESYGTKKEDLLFEETTINRVFDDITKEHPLLSKIKPIMVGGSTKWYFSETQGVATWQKLATAIKDFADATFNSKEVGLFSLSIGMFLHQSVLKLGPVWLDKYVRTVLGEAMTVGLELGVVDGKGSASDEPCGLMRDPELPAVNNEQPRVITKKIAKLDKSAFLFVKGKLNKNRKYKKATGNIMMLMHPDTYAGVVLEDLMIQNVLGQYIMNTPIAVDFVESHAVPFGQIACGYPQDYQLVVGKPGAIEYSDEYKFMDNTRSYKSIAYANGRPLHANRFIVLELEGVTNPFDDEEIPEV